MKCSLDALLPSPLVNRAAAIVAANECAEPCAALERAFFVFLMGIFFIRVSVFLTRYPGASVSFSFASIAALAASTIALSTGIGTKSHRHSISLSRERMKRMEYC